MTKSIRSSSDLAINGAPPAFAEPLHVGRPNIGDRGDFLALVNQILDRRWLTNNGPVVQELERRIAAQIGVRHCVAMCNGTVALEIAIRALGLTGEVIVPAYTFIATAHALQWQGITPIFADIDPATHNLSPASVLDAVSDQTSGIIGVHLWGRAAPVHELQEIADRHGLKLLFDAAHAFGCSYKGRMVGGFGSCEVLSFHATKFFNTFEGGAVVTNDNHLADRLRLMRNFGFAGYDNVIDVGTNGKMPEVCAAMGLANLDALHTVIDGNRRQYLAYREEISSINGLRLLSYDDQERSNFQYIVVEVEPVYGVDRDNLVRTLHAENILARKYFWPGCQSMKPYVDLSPKNGLRLENTRTVAERVIVLPTGPSLPADAIKIIGAVFRALS
jgi:dTDP-4-amino-4,6-dideoxygalactose transaminase